MDAYSFDVGQWFLYDARMARIHSASNWVIKVQGNEHPPVHAHVLHPDGRASIGLTARWSIPAFPSASSRKRWRG